MDANNTINLEAREKILKTVTDGIRLGFALSENSPQTITDRILSILKELGYYRIDLDKLTVMSDEEIKTEGFLTNCSVIIKSEESHETKTAVLKTLLKRKLQAQLQHTIEEIKKQSG